MKRWLLVALFGSLASVAQAQEAVGPFVGVSFGSFHFKETDQAFGLRISDSTGARRLFGGYQFSERLAVEAGWAETRDIEEDFRAVDPALGNVSIDTTAVFEVWTLRVLGFKPLKKVTLFGGIGYYDGRLRESGRYEDDFDVFTYAFRENDSGGNVIGGLQFDLKRVSIRAEYEWFDADTFNGSNVDMWGANLGLLFRF